MSKPRHIPPPPTKYGPQPAQAKPAQGARPGGAAVPPPPTRYGVVPAPPASIQAKPLAPNLPLVLQAMEESKEIAESIGARIRRRNTGSRFKSERMREKLGATKQIIKYSTTASRGSWNNKRPGWYDETWEKLATNSGVDPMQYTCVKCGKGPLYRKKDAPNQPRADDATIDHKKNWWDYITSNAKPRHDGSISSVSARRAYNDLANLQIMCRSCNAKKNGPKNVHD